MADRKTILFLSVRALSAAINVISIAIFTRLAGPLDYGAYLIIFAWATIVFGFTTQWMKFSYFGVYRDGPSSDEFLISFSTLLLLALSIVLSIILLSAATGAISPSISFPIFSLVLGMTIYEGSFEASRTRQNNKIMVVAMLSRAVLILALGTVVLAAAESPQNLAYAIAAAHLLAAIPSIYSFRKSKFNAASRITVLRIILFGWPLALSFGVIAIGQSIDRLLLAHLAGPDKMAPYGVVADFLRQSFMVAGEGIALSLITSAKYYFNIKENAASEEIMRKAFTACLSAALFGALFFIFLGNAVISVLLGPEFRQSAMEAMPLLAIAFAVMTIRLFYFSQVIYFTSATHLELLSSLIFVFVSSTCVFLFVPSYEAQGAAWALLLANIATTAFLVVVSRRYLRLPIDWDGACFIVILALVTCTACWLASLINAIELLQNAVQLTLFLIAAIILLIRFRFWNTAKTSAT